MIPQKELADMRLTADNLRKTDMNDASMYIDKLFAHIDEQASQITTLKTALIKEWAARLNWLPNRKGELSWDEEAKIEAASQLAKEYPEITWEEKK